MNKDQLRDDLAALFRSAPGAGRLGDEPPGTIADAVLEVVAPLLAEAEKKIAHLEMFERRYFDVQKVLDEALGTEEEDGAGGGIAGDVWLLGEKLRKAEASRRDWATEAMRLDCIAESVLTAVSRYDDKLRFMARRYLSNGPGLNFRRDRCMGVSSDALAWFAVGSRDEPRRDEYPLDPSDLAACERTYEMAPEFLRERMKPVLDRYRASVAKDYPEVASRPVCAVHPEGDGADDKLPDCAHCGGRGDNNWFDRTICPCGDMHTRCRQCGHALDGCAAEDEVSPPVSRGEKPSGGAV